jgi:nitrite reductase/ring-hydroxylating ferredoxin subunit
VSFQRVASVSEVPDAGGLCVRIDGIDVGLFKVGDDIFAMENRCPHRGDPLTEGELLGPVIVCAAHGWAFDVRTGFRPDDSDGFPIPCFDVRIEEGAVWVDLERPSNRR